MDVGTGNGWLFASSLHCSQLLSLTRVEIKGLPVTCSESAVVVEIENQAGQTHRANGSPGARCSRTCWLEKMSRRGLVA